MSWWAWLLVAEAIWWTGLLTAWFGFVAYLRWRVVVAAAAERARKLVLLEGTRDVGVWADRGGDGLTDAEEAMRERVASGRGRK